MSLTIELSIVSMSEGVLHIGHSECGCVDIDVDLEFDYSPAEAMTLEYPGCEEELILTSVQAPFGSIDIDTIQNLDQFNDDAYEMMHREGLEPSECPELFNGTMIALDKLSI